MATDLYSVIPGIQPSQQDLLEGQLMAVQILQARYPNLDLREGTGLRDTLIQPAGMVATVLKLALDYLNAQDTVNNMTDSTNPNIVDSVMSNWFVTRNTGTNAVISARLYFARQKSVAISSDVFFSPDNVSLYYPAQSLSFTASAMQHDTFSGEWFIDVNLTAAAEGSQYNISSGSLLYFSSFDPYFLHAEINYLVNSSSNTETNTEFIARTENSISTRNLINNPSIISNLQDNFNYLKQIQPIGFGDPEMVRDQIQAVFSSQTPVLLTALTSIGTTATATLANHGYNSGQIVLISGASPSGYNGSYTITVIDTSHFTYTLGSSLGVVTVLPTVNYVNNPIQIHNGGKVDVYCGNTLASAILQLTLDSFGNGHLIGPIFSFGRSQISGGSVADTVPLNNTVTLTSLTISGATAVGNTAAPHPFKVGDNITVSGATQNQTISAISCVGLTVTATVTSHGFLVGDHVIISGVTPTGYNGTFVITAITTNTFSYMVALNIATSGSGTMIASVNLVNITAPISAITTNTFTYPIAHTSTFAVSGTIIAAAPVDYTWVNTYNTTQTATTISASGTTTVTVTLPLHGYTLNRSITITGSSVSAFNGTWVISSIISQNQFSFLIPTSVTGTSVVGNITSPAPWYDYGFSQSQDLTVSLGSQYANDTISFEVNYFNYLDGIQAYLVFEGNRILCADYLARGFNFYYLNINVVSYNTTAPSATLVQQICQSYLDTLNPGDTFIISDMVAKLRYNGIINIQNPPTVTYTQYTRDLLTPQTGTIHDVLDPNDRTNIFIINMVTTGTVSLSSSLITVS